MIYCSHCKTFIHYADDSSIVGSVLVLGNKRCPKCLHEWAKIWTFEEFRRFPSIRAQKNKMRV
jgi:hypothetical protein